MLKIKNICCKKKMIQENEYINDTDYIHLICLDCGSFKTITSGFLDDEVLENYTNINNNHKDNYKEVC